MPNLHQFLHAARCGFTFYESINRFVRFLIRDDGRGYDVSAVTPDAVLDFDPTQKPRLSLDGETARRVTFLCQELCDPNLARVRVINVVVDDHGRFCKGVAHENYKVTP